MGLLDDAIREHLELKRKRGADPSEVEKEEREALGPVGGAATTAAPDTRDEVEDAPEAELDEPAALSEPEPEPLTEPPPAAPPTSRDTVGQPTEQYSVEEMHAFDREQEESDDEPDEPDLLPPRRAREPDDEPDEDVVPADEDPGAEDVLDETPEFLQEAPEHDRLWFEQKPPRDFDF